MEIMGVDRPDRTYTTSWLRENRPQLGTSHPPPSGHSGPEPHVEPGIWGMFLGWACQATKQPSEIYGSKSMSFLQNDGNYFLIIFIKIACDAMFYIVLLLKCPHVQLKCCVSVGLTPFNLHPETTPPGAPMLHHVTLW